MFGRQLPSHLDALHPRKHTERGRVDDMRKGYVKGDKVWIKNFLNNNPAWLPAVVVEDCGKRSFATMTQDGRRYRRHVDHMKRRYTLIENAVQESPYHSCPGNDSPEDNRFTTTRPFLSSGAERPTKDAPTASDSSPNAYPDLPTEAGTPERTQRSEQSQAVPDCIPRSRYGRVLKAPERLGISTCQHKID